MSRHSSAPAAKIRDPAGEVSEWPKEPVLKGKGEFRHFFQAAIRHRNFTANFTAKSSPILKLVFNTAYYLKRFAIPKLLSKFQNSTSTSKTPEF
jgi:hypothetical protein